MKSAGVYITVILLVFLAASACRSSAPTNAVVPVPANTSAAPSVEAATDAPSTIPVSSPPPTTARLELEILQTQSWTDRDGNVRVNALMRNPYEFPVAFQSTPRATLLNRAGEFMRDDGLYFLDGISGGTGFLLPGETVAANGCFTCEREPLTEEWSSVAVASTIEDATGSWDYSTEVEAAVGNVTFSGDSPIFDVSGTVRNNSVSALDRISVRVFVFDQEGVLVGAAEASAWEVGPGATVSFDGYGIGEAPAGLVEYEVTALGVKY